MRTALAALHRRTGSTDDDDAGSVQREDSEIEPSDRMAVEIGPDQVAGGFRSRFCCICTRHEAGAWVYFTAHRQTGSKKISHNTMTEVGR